MTIIRSALPAVVVVLQDADQLGDVLHGNRTSQQGGPDLDPLLGCAVHRDAGVENGHQVVVWILVVVDGCHSVFSLLLNMLSPSGLGSTRPERSRGRVQPGSLGRPGLAVRADS